jgi:hypothetical protein
MNNRRPFESEIIVTKQEKETTVSLPSHKVAFHQACTEKSSLLVGGI